MLVEQTFSLELSFLVRDLRVRGAQKVDNLDFDARVPIPISVFPSTYRSDATSEETTTTQVEGEVNLGAQIPPRVGREDTRFSGKEEFDISVNQQYRPAPQDRQENVQFKEDVHIHKDFVTQQPRVEENRFQFAGQQPRVEENKFQFTRTQDNRYPQVDITRERYQGQAQAPVDYTQDVNVDINVDRSQGVRFADVAHNRQAYRNTAFQNQLDTTEREYRRRVQPSYDIEYERSRPVAAQTEVVYEREQISSSQPKSRMGYYDDAGQYHSFRRGVQRAVDHVVHPFSHHRHHHHHQGPEVVIEEDIRIQGTSQSQAAPAPQSASAPAAAMESAGTPNTVTIPCHFIRIGDLLVLQGRPCQVIRISTSGQTGQYRYLGVDLFTKQLHEESSFVSNPEPSVIVQSMLGPVFKQYRILDMGSDGQLVCMTETGDVKQGLPVVDQGGLYSKINSAFADGRGSVRALVINDSGRELIVDYKVIHGSRL